MRGTLSTGDMSDCERTSQQDAYFSFHHASSVGVAGIRTALQQPSGRLARTRAAISPRPCIATRRTYSDSSS